VIACHYATDAPDRLVTGPLEDERAVILAAHDIERRLRRQR
jgi:hypothetical protein